MFELKMIRSINDNWMPDKLQNPGILYVFLTDNFFAWADDRLEFLNDPNETDYFAELTDLCKHDGIVAIKWCEDKDFSNAFRLPTEELKKIIKEFVRLNRESATEVIIKSEDGEYYTIEGKFTSHLPSPNSSEEGEV